jgi:uncharacterized protein YfbU (UPF0304 family)
MTNEELLYHYNRMAEIFADKLPNPEHYPKMFEYYALLYKHYHMVDKPKDS